MPPIPLGVQRLAAQLVQRMPWLARNRHIGALARLLHRHQLNGAAGWTAERVLHVLETVNRETHHLVPDPATQRNPLGYLHTRLAAAAPALHTYEPAPQQRARPAAAWQVEGEERRRQIEAADPAEIAAIIAGIRADIVADRSKTSRPAPSAVRARRLS